MWAFTWLAVLLAGGKAIRLRPANRTKKHPPLHGLILGGGADIGVKPDGTETAQIIETAKKEEASGPRKLIGIAVYLLIYLIRRLFGLPNLSGSDPARDAYEHALLEQAYAAKLPVLGICRGAQLINVHLGGSLHRDLTDFYTEQTQIRTVLPKKAVRITPESRLNAVTDSTTIKANSLHRQAVNELGQGLAASAHEHTGVIQAIEHKDRPFILGVQWHPEFLPRHTKHQALFRELVQQARRAMEGGTSMTALR